MAKLNIAADLSLPLDVASQAIAVLGIRGAGKTNTATVVAEELLSKGQPIVYIDPTDAAWGLRSDFPIFIFGGTHGDLPLQETDGKVLAEFVVVEQVPIILSLRHLRKNAQRRFVTEFCEEIYHLKGKPENRTPLTVFIDEAPLFVPQKVMGETARTVGAVEDLIARGRNAGFGVVLISQRSATLNKDVLTQCDTIITHRLTSPQDRKALSDWIEENATIEKQKEILHSLAAMPNGQAWIWSPRLDIMKQVQIRLRRTFDSSATPKRGEQPARPKRLEEVDIGKLKTKLAAAIEEAERNDPKALQAKVEDLEAKVAELEARGAAPDAEILAEARREGADRARHQMADALRSDIDAAVTQLTVALNRAFEVTGGLNTIARALASSHATINPTAEQSAELRELIEKQGPGGKLELMPYQRDYVRKIEATKPGDKVRIGRNEYNVVSENGALPKGERAILIAVKQHRGCTREQLTVLTGYRKSSRDAYIQRLIGRGLVASIGGNIIPTGEGDKALGADFKPLPTGRALREHWFANLPHGEAALLRLIVEDYPREVTREKLSQKSGYQKSSRDAYLQRLKSRRLIEVVAAGEVKAAAVLF